uniref:Fibrinogen C-terminal domain-containing protein n=1 Tax=Hucho hucho TaxID=62062 RepID=A0A4W5LLG9_9TELE
MMFSLMLALLVPVVVQSYLHPVDCNEVYQSGSGMNGVYTIYPAGNTSPVQVFCEMSMDSANPGKWTLNSSAQRVARQYITIHLHFKAPGNNKITQ